MALLLCIEMISNVVTGGVFALLSIPTFVKMSRRYVQFMSQMHRFEASDCRCQFVEASSSGLGTTYQWYYTTVHRFHPVFGLGTQNPCILNDSTFAWIVCISGLVALQEAILVEVEHKQSGERDMLVDLMATAPEANPDVVNLNAEVS